MKTKGLLILFFLVGCISCIDDRTAPTPSVVASDSDEVAMKLEIQLPPATQTTYGVSAATETNIEEITLLVFEVDETDPSAPVESFAYLAQARNIQDNGSADRKTFEATVYKKERKQRFVLLANAADEMDQLGNIAQGTLKESILGSVVCHRQEGWDTGSTTAFTSFPFWGESDLLVIGESVPVIETIPMLRMLARIDVSVTDEPVQKIFEITSVHLYNRKSCGRVAPDADNVLQNKAINVSLPATNLTTIKGPQEFAVPAEEKHAFIRSIYTFESPAVGTPDEATCIVIGGVYGEDTQPTYYRVDFVDTDESGNVTGYKNILRNHLYRVNISDVKGSGHGGPDEAFNAKAENITVEVVEWDEGTMSDVVFDGQYLLSVDPGEITLSREAQQGIGVKAYTDYPSGWTATIDNSNYPWITLVSGSSEGVANVISSLYFDIEENPDAANSREAIIKITAGRLTYNVKVIQTSGSLLSLTVVDTHNEEVDQLIFESAVGLTNATPQNLTVRWTPLTVVCEVTGQDNTTPAFAWGNGVDPVADSPLAGGERTFSIAPTGMTAAETDVTTGDPFLEKRKVLTFSITDGSETETKSVELIQLNYALVAYPASPYNLDGGTYSFKVRSNARWEAVLKSGNMVQTVITTSGVANTAEGIDFYFKTVNSTTLTDPTATFTFSSPEGKFADVDVTITGMSVIIEPAIEEANCYILQPSGNGIRIPVSHANTGLTIQIASGQEMKAELLWTDVAAGMASNGAVASAYVEGNGPSAELVVIPGSSEGNALIALRDASDNTILWSWHIWVVDYDPDNGGTTYTLGTFTFMDRNLGATSSDPGSNKAIGLTYQWGRKDPFPGVAAPPATTEVTIYDAQGSVTGVAYSQVNVDNNLLNSIEKPVTFYTGVGGTGGGAYNDWYATTDAARNDNLWGALYGGTVSNKTTYDPCPAGWRTPPVTSGSNPWWSFWDWTNAYHSSYIGAYHNEIGYWPIPGTRSSTDGAFTDLTTSQQRTLYWYGSSNQIPAHCLELIRTTSINNTSSQNVQRATGAYVRCVKK